jgi:hypothetical protein
MFRGARGGLEDEFYGGRFKDGLSEDDSIFGRLASPQHQQGIIRMAALQAVSSRSDNTVKGFAG